MIDLTDSPGLSALEVEVNNCAIKAGALLACKHGVPPASQIRWRGKGNQYDIFGPTWIVLSASTGTPALSIAATDLKSWSLFAPEDRNPSQEKLAFQTDTATQTTLAQPGAYKIQSQTSNQLTPGTDPEQIGPWSIPNQIDPSKRAIINKAYLDLRAYLVLIIAEGNPIFNGKQ